MKTYFFLSFGLFLFFLVFSPSIAFAQPAYPSVNSYSSVNFTNSTIAGTPMLFKMNWTAAAGTTLSGYIFSFDNGTGTLTNDTWTAFTGITWANASKTVNSTVGSTIKWCFYANDSSDNWNGTSCSSPFVFATTAGYPFVSTVNLTNPTANVVNAKYATQENPQRKSFYANGLYWVFYSDGVNMLYSTSTDGSTWTGGPQSPIRAGVQGEMFSIWFDGTYVYYAYGNYGAVYYRMGTPLSNGTIIWNATEQNTGQSETAPAFVATDSNGYPWIAFPNTSTSYLTVIKGLYKNGTWANDDSVGPTRVASRAWSVILVPLTAGKMAAVYTTYNVPISIRIWNGSSWGNEINTTNITKGFIDISAVAIGDNVHIVYTRGDAYLADSVFNYTANSFSPDTTIYYIGIGTGPALSIETLNNYIYAFLPITPYSTLTLPFNHIYYIKYNGTVWDAAPTDWITETAMPTSTPQIGTSFYQAANHAIGFEYTNSLTGPYQIKFAYLNTNVPIYSSRATNIVSPYSGDVALSTINVTWINATDNMDTSIIQLNNVNYTMTRINQNSISTTYGFSIDLPPGNYNYTFYANTTAGVWNTPRVTPVNTFSVFRAIPVLVLSNGTASISTSGLIGYWRFENESLGIATDYSGWGNNATLNNTMNLTGNETSGPTLNGYFGRGMLFDGSNNNDYVSIPNSAVSTGSGQYLNPFSISFWFNPNDFSSNKVLLSRWNSTGNNYIWGLVTQGNGANVPWGDFIIFNSTTGTYPGYAASTSPAIGYLEKNKWYHIVLEYNTTHFLLYENGVYQWAYAVPPIYNGISNLKVGADGSGATGNAFNGTIDEIMFWNRTLTSDEVNMLYQSQVLSPTQTNITSSNCPTASSNPPAPDVTCTLYRNTTVIGTGTISDVQTLGTGYYYYLYNTSGGANYSQSTLLIPLNTNVTTYNLTQPNNATIIVNVSGVLGPVNKLAYGVNVAEMFGKGLWNGGDMFDDSGFESPDYTSVGYPKDAWFLVHWGTSTYTFSRDNTTKIDGIYSQMLNITSYTSGGTGLFQNWITLQQGHTYQLTFWAKQTGNAVNVTVYIQLDHTPSTIFATVGVPVNSSWTQYSFNFTPTQTDEYSVYTEVVGGPTATWIDNYTMYDTAYSFSNVTLNPTFLAPILQIAPTVIRIPGGAFAETYHWKYEIGNSPGLPSYGNFGGPNSPDRFMQLSNALNASTIITVNYYSGTAQEAADWVEYMNAPNDGYSSWAAVRAFNGHPAPYNVKYWEIGNEIDLNSLISGTTYANKYLTYYNAMKAVDPSIKIGANIPQYATGTGSNNEWTTQFLQIAGNKTDFLIFHQYYPGSATFSSSKYFGTAGAANDITNRINEFENLVAALVPNKAGQIPVAVTEYNALFSWDKPSNSRGSMLEGGLVTADLVQAFIKQQSNVSISTIWNLINENFANDAYSMIFNFKTLRWRPQAYVLQLYTQHFGDILINTSVSGPMFNLSIPVGVVQSLNNVPYLDVIASLKNNRFYLLVVNKHNTNCSQNSKYHSIEFCRCWKHIHLYFSCAFSDCI